MHWSISSSIETSCGIFQDRSVLWTLHQGVTRVFSVVILLHLRVVLAIVADSSLCRSVLCGRADESTEVGFALAIVNSAMLVQGAVIAVITSRVMIIKLSVVKVGMLGLAVGVLVCLVIKPPIPGGILNVGCRVDTQCICSLTLER